jgi:hypothetical protein
VYGISRPRIESFVETGRQVVNTLTPMFVDVQQREGGEVAKHRLGSPTLFTHAQPVSGKTKSGEVARICVCCESAISPDDTEMVLTIFDRSEVAWCSRECAREFPIDAFMVSNRYHRHWANIVLHDARDPVDDRSRVREITDDRMEILRDLAIKQGYRNAVAV